MTEKHVNPEDPDLYALGALDGEEKRAFEAHVRGCASCAGELEAARERVALLALAAPGQTPRPELKEELMRRVRQDRATSAPVAGSVKVPVLQGVRVRRFSWLTPMLATATLVLAVVAGWLWTRNQFYLQQVRTLQAQLTVAQTQSLQIARAAEDTDHLLGMPGTVRVALAPQTGASGRAGVLFNSRMGMVMCAGQMAPAPAGKSYQLWMVPMKGAPVSLGVFSEADPMRPVTAHVTPGMEAKAFAITVEPQGGMPQPTGPKVMVGAVAG